MKDRGSERRGSIVIGAILIAVGAVFLIGRQLDIDVGRAGWPALVIIPGLILLVLAFVVGGGGGSGFAVAGGIVTVTGLVLAFQNQTGLWSTWAYAWALVAPGGAGLGLAIYGALTRQRDLALAGAWALLVGLALFLAFAFFFESVIGLSGGRIQGLDAVLAAGLVILGLVIVGFSLRPVRRAR